MSKPVIFSFFGDKISVGYAGDPRSRFTFQSPKNFVHLLNGGLTGLDQCALEETRVAFVEEMSLCLSTIYNHKIFVKSSRSRVIILEAVNFPSTIRLWLSDVFLNALSVGGIKFVNDLAASTFTTGRSTALTIRFDNSSTIITPVVNGRLLYDSMITYDTGSALCDLVATVILTSMLLKNLKNIGDQNVDPNFYKEASGFTRIIPEDTFIIPGKAFEYLGTDFTLFTNKSQSGGGLMGKSGSPFSISQWYYDMVYRNDINGYFTRWASSVMKSLEKSVDVVDDILSVQLPFDFCSCTGFPIFSMDSLSELKSLKLPVSLVNKMYAIMIDPTNLLQVLEESEKIFPSSSSLDSLTVLPEGQKTIIHDIFDFLSRCRALCNEIISKECSIPVPLAILKSVAMSPIDVRKALFSNIVTYGIHANTITIQRGIELFIKSLYTDKPSIQRNESPFDDSDESVKQDNGSESNIYVSLCPSAVQIIPSMKSVINAVAAPSEYFKLSSVEDNAFIGASAIAWALDTSSRLRTDATGATSVCSALEQCMITMDQFKPLTEIVESAHHDFGKMSGDWLISC